MSKRSVDIVVHIPLEEELREFLALFPIDEEFPTELNLLALVKAPGGFSVGLVMQEKMGRAAAQAACHTALETFDCKAYICLGIAGGLSKDLNLGDVCYTGTLIDVYDNSKVVDGKDGGIDIEFAPEFYTTERRITSALGFVRTLTQLKDLHEFWQEDQRGFAEKILLADVPGRGEERERLGAPKCLNGDIVCGAVAESDHYRNRIKGITRKILAVETESGPIFEICRDRGLIALTIRGISDYANASKGALEGESKSGVRKVAARNAAAFLHMQLQSPLFAKAIKGHAAEDSADELPLGDVTTNPLPEIVDQIAGFIDSKLRELSPPYRTKPVGYRLPTPRVRKKQAEVANGDKSKKPTAIEVVDAVGTYKRMLVYVPRTYPDQALPWVIAQALLDIDLDGKKAIPIVLDGKKIGPPRDTFDRLSQVGLDPEIGAVGGQYVFIVDEPRFNSRTRFGFLTAEADKWTDAHIIYLTKSDRGIVEADESYRSLKADTFSLCDVSFFEIAVFLEKAFDMPGKEADVVALKLRNMFAQFSLPAHPSFFAGIPSEALSALLLANRRSELIQLAVDGVLSFIVAADADPVRMSRTNRAKFLRGLVVEIAHQKRRFSEGDLIAYAQRVSDEFDYGLDSALFIKSFVDAGILYFEDGIARITLPFVEAYLLADELSKDEALAKAYFQCNGDDFDFLTFDLYAEIGPSHAFVVEVMDSLESLIAECAPDADKQLMLTGEIHPALFKNPNRVRVLSRKVTEAREAVASGESDRREKSSVLDIADRVNDDIAEQADGETAKSSSASSNEPHLIKMLLRQWLLATILLGAGAESIKGDDRQRLAKAVIAGGEALIDQMSKHFLAIDFEDIKNKIIADKPYRESLGIKEDDTEFSNIVSAFVDFIEYLAYSQPLERVFDYLPDQARHRIVGNSVERVVVDTKMQKLIRGVWLTSINQKAGRKDMMAAIGNLPNVQFLRAALTSILINRVKWKVPDHDTQNALLDAAEHLVKPYNPNLNKGEIIRFVAKQGGADAEDDADDGS